MTSLITLAEFAERWQITVEEMEALRRRHRWPHVKAGRKNIRFTPEQVTLIERQHTAGGPASTRPAIELTPGSARRAS